MVFYLFISELGISPSAYKLFNSLNQPQMSSRPAPSMALNAVSASIDAARKMRMWKIAAEKVSSD